MEPESPAPPIDLLAGEDRILPKDEKGSFSIPMVGPAAASTLLLDVTPRGLGVATAGGYCDQIIERNAAIPVEQSRLFSTSTDNQTAVAINIFQGESRRVEQNTLLGQVHLPGIRPAQRGEVKIKVVFEIDTDGILGVSAVNEETGAAQDTRIQLLGGLNEDQVNALVSKYSKS
jgi:molecular chaperone DnaK